jgi:hypothetical protein
VTKWPKMWPKISVLESRRKGSTKIWPSSFL